MCFSYEHTKKRGGLQGAPVLAFRADIMKHHKTAHHNTMGLYLEVSERHRHHLTIMRNTMENLDIEVTEVTEISLADAITAATDKATERMSVDSLRTFMQSDKKAKRDKASWTMSAHKAGVTAKQLQAAGSVERGLFEGVYADVWWTSPERKLAAKTTAEAKKISKEDQIERQRLLACCRTYLASAATALKHLESGITTAGGGANNATKYTSIEKTMAALVATTEALDKGETDMEIKIKKKFVKLQDELVAAYVPCKEAFKKVTGESRLYRPIVTIKKS